MKILYVANERVPTDRASGLQIMKTCEALAENGAEVELLLPARKTEAVADDPFDYYRVKRIFALKKLFCLDLIPYLSFLGPAPYWLISFTFSLSVLAYSVFRKRDILYFRHDIWLFWFLIFLKKNLVDEIHFLAGDNYRRYFKKLLLVVVVNESAKAEYEKNPVLAEKIIVAPDGVSLEDFDISTTQEEARRKLGLSLNSRLVLYTGHFYEWKGIDALIEAANFFSEDTMFLLVGGDTPEDSAVFKNPLPPNIKKTGQKSYSEIPLYLKAADCLVLTGTKKDERSYYYTSPLKLFEYMASGRPIVASDTGALREILAHNENGWLVRPDDKEALAAGIRYVLENPALATRLAQRARSDAESYTWRNRGRIIVSAIKEKRNSISVLYVFAGTRGYFYDNYKKGLAPDTQLLGLNHMQKLGIKAEFVESRAAQFLRKISFNLVHIPYLFYIRNYDVVFIGAGLPMVFLARYIFRWGKPYFVVYNTFFTNIIVRNKNKKLLSFIIRRAIEGIDMIVCTARVQEEFLLKQGFAREKIVFLPIGIDAESFVRASQEKGNKEENYILSVGRDLGRDYETLIEAARGENIEVRIATARRNVAHIKNIPPNVKFFFDVPYEEMPAMYRGARFVVTPLRGGDDSSGSDTTGQYGFLEPMASGKAVIVSRRPTVVDYIEDGVDGILVEPGDPRQLRKAMDFLIKNPGAAEKLGKTAQKKVAEKFSSRRFAEDLAGIFKDLVWRGRTN